MRNKLIASLVALLVSMPVIAAEQISGMAVHATHNETSKIIKGKITGYETADHTVQVAAGQTLSVNLKTGNTSSYFNVTAPGANEAMFIGSTSGNVYEGLIPASGVYTIRVYMMRNAARRDEVAQYTLSIKAK